MNAKRWVRLTREIRFFLSADSAPQSAGPVLNSWSAWPACKVVAPFVSVQCTLQGFIDPRTDYVCNVKEVDAILRQHAICDVWDRFEDSLESIPPSTLLSELWRSVAPNVPEGATLDALRVSVSPFLSFHMDKSSFPMIYASQQFEFSASHRLHNWALSEEENRRLYGKCNNPHGHGHNYVVEVCLELPKPRPEGYSTMQTEQIVRTKVIDRLDHRHLNIEVPPFDKLNPTVENIAVTIWEWLDGEFPETTRLVRVRVYETPKTWADYTGLNPSPTRL